MSRKILARGLILRADASFAETTYRGQRFELRALTLDIEVPGQAPYEISVTPRVPRIVEALPGATLDVLIDPSNPNDVEILGPAGAVDWLRAAAAVPRQRWGPPEPVLPALAAAATPFVSAGTGGGSAPYALPVARAARKGCGVVVLVIAVMFFVFVVGLVMLVRHESGSTHAPATHAPRATPEHRSRPGHPH